MPAVPVFPLTRDLSFPPVELASREGLLAVGGDLSRERLLLAYSLGIFPWYGEGDPIMWWSPNPRMVLFPDDFHVSRRLRRTFRTGNYVLTLDQAYEKTIAECADIARPGQDGTWITREMEQAYIDLYEAGYAHSAECWEDGRLTGGLYGVALGGCFFGESMFSRRRDASKLALWALIEQLHRWGFAMIDCQVRTDHLASLGAREIPRREFRRRLKAAMQAETRLGRWTLDPDLPVKMD